MKKIFTLFMAIMAIYCFTACQSACEKNGHSYNEQKVCTVCDYACEHSTYSHNDDEAMCDECGYICEHAAYEHTTYAYSYDKSVCKECGYICEHTAFSYNDDEAVCNECGYICEHIVYEYDDKEAICKECGYSCEHKYTDTAKEIICSNCSYTIDKIALLKEMIMQAGEKSEDSAYIYHHKVDDDALYSFECNEENNQIIYSEFLLLDNDYIYFSEFIFDTDKGIVDLNGKFYTEDYDLLCEASTEIVAAEIFSFDDVPVNGLVGVSGMMSASQEEVREMFQPLFAASLSMCNTILGGDSLLYFMLAYDSESVYSITLEAFGFDNVDLEDD